MRRYIAGVITTLIIIFTIYAFKSGNIGNIGLAFVYFSLMCFVYGLNFGMFLKKENPDKKD